MPTKKYSRKKVKYLCLKVPAFMLGLKEKISKLKNRKN